jgi:hypothetical protein
MVTVAASDRARYLAATPVAAAVRLLVISPESMIASGRPLLEERDHALDGRQPGRIGVGREVRVDLRGEHRRLVGRW